MILDGKTNRYEAHLPYAAPALKAAGVQVYSVGIGNIDIAELQLISSDPDDEHVFILSSFRDAAGFVDFLSVTTCESQFTMHHVMCILISGFGTGLTKPTVTHSCTMFTTIFASTQKLPKSYYLLRTTLRY